MSARVSVIIPHFNRSDLIEASVASVLASASTEVEVIVVDDGSSPDHLDRLLQVRGDRVRILERGDGEKGPSRCRNLGVAASDAPYVIFLDSDDIMSPWCVEQRLTAAAEAPQADLWVFPVMLFDSIPGDRGMLWNRMDNGIPAAVRFVSSDPPWHTSSPLWKRASFLDLGGFNDKVFYGDDSDLHMRALVTGLDAQLYSDAIPDVFVRRSSAPRITNAAAGDLGDTRRARLSEGATFLTAAADRSRYLPLWASQYFAEAEFYLFNHPDPRESVGRILDQWSRDLGRGSQPPAVRAYFAVALRSVRNFYPAVRVARRAAMVALPAYYFPRAGELNTAEVSQEIHREVMRRLG
jgi:Glycosyltransferases involved in cell wall biogenesis